MPTQKKNKKKIAIGTRFFGKDPGKIIIIEKFIHQAIACVDQIFIAVNIEEDKTGIINNKGLKLPGVNIFGVTPWGEYIPALNILISKAKLSGADFMLLASAEMRFGQEQFSQLLSHLDEKTLAAGVALPGHDFKEGERLGNGRTIPWNTFCLWNLEYLSRTGFPLISDAFLNGKKSGVEEVTTIALLQKIYPFLTAKLIKIPGMEREIKYWDEQRFKRHLEEMENRKTNPAVQMKVFNIPPPKIIHLSAS